MIKESENKLATATVNPDTDLEIMKNGFISVPYVPSLSEEFRRIFQHTSAQVISKGANSLKSIIMDPKIKSHYS